MIGIQRSPHGHRPGRLDSLPEARLPRGAARPAPRALGSEQVQKKLDLLAQDPMPDSKVKKRLKNMDGAPCRLRSGDLRVFYTFARPYISLLSIRWRKDAYDDDVDAEFLGGPASRSFDVSAFLDKPARAAAPKRTKLPRPVTEELLAALRVEPAHFPRLLGLSTEEDLLNCPGVPDEVLLQGESGRRRGSAPERFTLPLQGKSIVVLVLARRRRWQAYGKAPRAATARGQRCSSIFPLGAGAMRRAPHLGLPRCGQIHCAKIKACRIPSTNNSHKAIH